MVAPLVEMPEARLASVEDIALMKLDALLARAARKDFYDLYFICQEIPLRKLLAMAPRKYPSVRDFETQTVKRLVYFENTEADPDPKLLISVGSGQRLFHPNKQTDRRRLARLILDTVRRGRWQVREVVCRRSSFGGKSQP